MSKKLNEQTTNGETESLDWRNYSRNGGTSAEFLNEQLRRTGLSYSVTSATTEEEQPARAQTATLRFVPVRRAPGRLEQTGTNDENGE